MHVLPFGEAIPLSGASTKGKKGLPEIADKGTVFLDEIIGDTEGDSFVDQPGRPNSFIFR